MSNSSIWSIDWTLPDATTQSQSEPGSNGDEEVLNIPQTPKTGASPYVRHALHTPYGLKFSVLSIIIKQKENFLRNVFRWS